eukprot:6070582-Pyramimonas_sp.AAC.1
MSLMVQSYLTLRQFFLYSQHSSSRPSATTHWKVVPDPVLPAMSVALAVRTCVPAESPLTVSVALPCCESVSPPSKCPECHQPSVSSKPIQVACP